jgi:hypothetical protein
LGRAFDQIKRLSFGSAAEQPHQVCVDGFAAIGYGSHRAAPGGSMKLIASPLVLSVAFSATATGTSPMKLRAALQFKPGLWEFEDRARVTGDSVFADALVAGIPPTQQLR